MCIDLPVKCRAFTIVSDGFYNVYLNSRHTYETNVKSLKHELKHINNGDFDKSVNVDEIEAKTHECFI